MLFDEGMRDTVTNLLQEASNSIILPFFKNLKKEQIETKSSPNDFVTVADRKSEDFLTEALIRLIDQSKVVGEEASSKKQNYFSVLEDEFVWTVDPVDGTKNFIDGNEQFCSMIALLHYGIAVASWVYIPKKATCYYADNFGVQVKHANAKYKILYRDGYVTKDSSVKDLRYSASLRHLSSDQKKKIRASFGAFGKRVFTGSVGIDATLLVTLKIDFIFHSITSPWDHAPVDMFNRALGGKTAQINFFDNSFIELNYTNKLPILFSRDINDWDKITSFFLNN